MLRRIPRSSLSPRVDSVGIGSELSGKGMIVVSVSSHIHPQSHHCAMLPAQGQLDEGDKGRIGLIPTQGGPE